jgi:hypothetical protein
VKSIAWDSSSFCPLTLLFLLDFCQFHCCSQRTSIWPWCYQFIFAPYPLFSGSLGFIALSYFLKQKARRCEAFFSANTMLTAAALSSPGCCYGCSPSDSGHFLISTLTHMDCIGVFLSNAW